jgi:BolA protein
MRVERELTDLLREHFELSFFAIENESFRHNVPSGSESHFKVTLVSSEFAGRRKVARHQAVYAVVADLLAGPIHALALHTYTPQEWAQRETSPASPPCLGGSAAQD